MIHSVRIQPFNFYSLRDFSQPEGANHAFQPLQVVEEAPPPPPPPPPPSFSEADLERAKQQAFSEGQTKGVLEGMEKAQSEDTERDTLLSSQLRTISAQLETMKQEHLHVVNAHRTEAVQLGIHIAGLIAGRALNIDPTSVAENLVNACLEHLIEEPKLTLQAHPMMTDAIRQKVEKMAQDIRFEGILSVEASPALSLTECKLTWANGEATLSPEAIWQDILTRLLPEHIRTLMPALSDILGTKISTSPAAITPSIPATPATTSENTSDVTLPVAPPSLADELPYIPPVTEEDLAAYTPEYRIARADENPIISDILHSIEEVIEATEKAEAEKGQKKKPPSTIEEG